jgi:hypothetical protein
MSYYVVWPDGRRFGPADLGTLQSWAAEGRISGTTEVEDIVAGVTVPASKLPGLTFEAVPPPSAPVAPVPERLAPPPDPASPYDVPGPASSAAISADNPFARPPGLSAPYPRASGEKQVGSNELTTAWVLYALGFVCGCGCLLQVPGLVYAYQAKGKGHPGGTLATIIGWVLVVLNVVGIAVLLLTSAR